MLKKVQYGERKTIEVEYTNGVSLQIFSTAFSELKFGGYFSSTLNSGPNMLYLIEDNCLLTLNRKNPTCSLSHTHKIWPYQNDSYEKTMSGYQVGQINEIKM